MRRLANTTWTVLLTLSWACGDDGVLQTTSGTLDVEPASVNFGPIAEGNTEVRNVVVTNSGTLALVVAPSLKAGSSPDFRVSSEDFGLAPRAIHSISIEYTPAGQGTDEGVLVLTPRDADVPPVEVPLSAGPIAPRLEIAPNPVDFSPAWTATVTRTATLTNAADANLTVSAIEVDVSSNQDFSVEPLAEPITIVPGEEYLVPITYRRSGNGENGVLVIRSDGSPGGEARVQLIPDRLPQCSDGVDNDGDSWIDFPEDPGCDRAMDDDEFDVPECTHGDTEVCGTDEGECETGTRECIRGRWSPCIGAIEPAPAELCDGLDNDCNGRSDEGISETCMINGCLGARVCVEGSTRAGGQWSACAPVVTEPEICDNMDNDCNGVIDDGLTQACSINSCDGTSTCDQGVWSDCAPDRPMAEICNGMDDDCNGPIDDGLGMLTCGIGACTATAAACSNGMPGMCTPLPRGTEVCNGIDDDCDGDTDEELLILTAPGDGTSSPDRQPNLTWTDRPNETYTLHLSTSPTLMPELPGYPVTNATTPHAITTPLMNGQTYYWRVDGETASGCTFTSTVQSFGVDPCNFTFSLRLPADGATVSTDMPTLAWDFGTGSRCAVNLTDAMGMPVPGYPRNNVIPPHMVPMPLADGTYRWSVDCTDFGGCMASAPPMGTRMFDVVTTCAVGTPTLSAPVDGIEWLGSPRFEWQSLGAGITYTVNVSTDPMFSNSSSAQTTSTNIMLSTGFNITPVPGTRYYWRVTASNGTCTGPTSAVRSVVVERTYTAAACSGTRESPTVALLGGGILGFSYASQLDFVETGPLAGKILVPLTDSDGLLTFAPRVRCFEANGLTPCTNGPGAEFGAQLGTDFNSNVPGLTVSPTGSIYVSASNGLSRAMYVFSNAGVLTQTIPLSSFVRGLLYDDNSTPHQILANDNGTSVMRSLTTAGANNWTTSTSALTNVEMAIEPAANRIFQTNGAGQVSVLSYSDASAAPTLLYSLTSQPGFTLADPSGVTGFIGPASNRRFIAVSDFSDPSRIVFFYVGTQTNGSDSFPVLTLTEPTAPLRYMIGLDRDPTTQDIFTVTHTTGGALRHGGFKIMRYCPET